jgi:hypothetical protein
MRSPPDPAPSPGPTVALRTARRNAPFPGQTDLAPQTTLQSARAGRHFDFARIGWLRCFMVLGPGRGRVPVVVYRQVCLGLQPLARLVHNLYVVE